VDYHCLIPADYFSNNPEVMLLLHLFNYLI